MFTANLVCKHDFYFLFTKFVFMKILITAATEMELSQIDSPNQDISTCISGIGAAIAMFHLQEALQHKSYDLVIQCGIAGSFNLLNYNIGSVVIASSDVFADVGVSANNKFKTLFELGFKEKNQFPFTNGLLENNTLPLKNFELLVAKAITVNTVTDDKYTIKQLQQKFAADIETMEGAALHYICLQKKIPFLQVRGISNEVGERDKQKWKIKETLQQVTLAVNKILNEHL